MKKQDEDYMAWLQGLYTRAAVVSAISKGAKYPSKPLDISHDDTQENVEAPDIASKKFDAWSKIYNKRFEKDKG